MTTPATAHELNSRDVHRVWTALAVTAVAVCLAWTVPVARWALPSTDTALDDAGRFAATSAALSQGWWAIIVVTVAVALGSLHSVVLAYSRGRNWTVTALRNAVVVASTLLVMWAIWTVSVFAAAGVHTTG